MRLAGRTAIVTGAGSGIGRASAVLFAKQGAFVALVDRDRAGLQETLTAIRGQRRSNGPCRRCQRGRFRESYRGRCHGAA